MMGTASDVADKPLLRGVLHQYGAFVALGAGIVLTAIAPTARAAWAAAGFSASLVLLFGVSATYHRVHWKPAARAWMRRADHASIFVLIAGSYTPVALLGLPDALGLEMFLLAWGAALVGVLQTMFWIRAPKVVTALLAVGVGWVGAPYWTEVRAALSDFHLTWIVAGGLFYTFGALCYALKKPNLSPKYFGYHEVFHLCTIVGAAMHFVVITTLVIAAGGRAL